MNPPTAMQSRFVQETDFSSAQNASGGRGVGRIFQVVAFDSSTSGDTTEPEIEYPTAMHLWGVGHETLWSRLVDAPAGTCGSWTDQLVPSKRSAMGAAPPEGGLQAPTS